MIKVDFGVDIIYVLNLKRHKQRKQRILDLFEKHGIENYEFVYKEFFKLVFQKLKNITIHSVTIGSLRMPKRFLKKLSKLYPNEPNKNYKNTDGKEEELLIFCKTQISNYVEKEKIFINN